MHLLVINGEIIHYIILKYWEEGIEIDPLSSKGPNKILIMLRRVLSFCKGKHNVQLLLLTLVIFIQSL